MIRTGNKDNAEALTRGGKKEIDAAFKRLQQQGRVPKSANRIRLTREFSISSEEYQS